MGLASAGHVGLHLVFELHQAHAATESTLVARGILKIAFRPKPV